MFLAINFILYEFLHFPVYDIYNQKIAINNIIVYLVIFQLCPKFNSAHD